MAQPVAADELGRWRGENVRLGEVIDALAGLRRAEQRTATRTCVTNLVLVAADQGDVAVGCDAVHRLGRRHPGRNIVLLPRPGTEPAGIDADVLLHGSVSEGRPVWSEDVRLEVRGAAADHLDSLVEPLTLPDLPVAVWFVRGLPRPDDPLVGAATTVLVDSEGLDTDALSALARLVRRHVVFDLCWARLRPWRQLLAAQFEARAARPFVGGVHGIVVEGPASPRLLLGGWLSARLGVEPSAVTLRDGDAVKIRLEATAGEATATFAVTEVAGAGGPVVRATANVDGADLREDRLSGPDDPLAWSLGEALTRLGRDRVYGQALQAALGFAA